MRGAGFGGVRRRTGGVGVDRQTSPRALPFRVGDTVERVFKSVAADPHTFFERMARHGERRAAEMEEVAETLRELGVEPLMTSATIKRQREMGQIGTQASVRGVLNKDSAALLHAISAAARDRH